jgi:imidazolonepropionase-like amidohydrolase
VAELLGLGGVLGYLEPGKNADLTIAAADPVHDIGALNEA